MKKLLDFLLIFSIVYLIFSFFLPKENPNDLNGDITFESSKSSYTIPASVWLLVTNNSNETLEFHTCRDIKINNSWEYLSFPEEFCKDLIVTSGDKYTLDYANYYEKFEKTWNYIFEINISDKKYLSQFEVENKSGIWKIFVALFYAPIYNLLIFILDIFSGSLWIAIILITILIRIALLWPQHKMMVSQRKLQAIQPKIKDLQEKHKHDKQALWVKLLELYKQEKVNPMWSCGFLLIQMPILLVIYNILINVTDPSNHYYIYEILKWFDLSSISYNFLWLDLLWQWWIAWFILALIVAIVQFIQVKLSLVSNKSNTKNIVLEKKKWDNSYNQFMPDPEMMNKFMLYGMPAMVWVFTYSLFAWIWIYWGIWTLFMIFQQLIVNKIVKK